MKGAFRISARHQDAATIPRYTAPNRFRRDSPGEWSAGLAATSGAGASYPRREPARHRAAPPKG
jgi:hypothetical protein